MAAKKVIKGKHTIKKHKVWQQSTFRRPKTQKIERKPKVKARASQKFNTYDKYAIIKHPVASETAIKNIEDNNTLTFIVDVRASKKIIKEAFKKLYNFDAKSVNTQITHKGLKKAYIKIGRENEAMEIANKIGIM